MSPRTLLICVLLMVVSGNDASPTRERRMTTAKMRASDLDGSATAYVYTQQQGLPVYYVQYTNHGSGRYYHAPEAVQYVAPVAQAAPEAPILLPYAAAGDVPGADKRTHEETLTQAVAYNDEQLAKHAAVPVKPGPRAPYYGSEEDAAQGQGEGVGARKDIEEDQAGESDEDDSDEDDEENHGDSEISLDEGIHGDLGHTARKFNSGDGHGYRGNGGSDVDGGSSFQAGGGEEHATEEHSEHGEKGDKGYRSYKKFSDDERGSRDKGHREGYYSNKGGHEKGHVDEAEEHGSHSETEKSKEGNDYSHSSSYKKGQKTNGFHNVYHKDEYKKETDFYDDDHKKGHFDKFEEFDKGYKEVEGGFKKGGHRSSGHDQQDGGKKGYYDKGHHQSQDQGYEGEEGGKSYHENHAGYAVDTDTKSAKVHKFSKDS
ncbi:uncharacterized protein LOC143366917 [Andrena cerasifolii]|uniref:uncharacterized protein LOC143366917 n=1 Tax=Andrena cerasifolii TaxID=2819439 RepID=UPI004037BDA4